MASQSPPSTPPDDNPSSPDPTQAPVNEGQATPGPPDDVSQKNVFVNSQPLREDQVQNAVKFLSHPRVKGSPVVHRRNFLERKGLTKEEIDEAFRRVPDPSPALTSGQTNGYSDAQSMPATNAVAQAPVQAMQPVKAAPSGVMSTMARRYHWSHAVLGVGFLAISGAGTAIVFKNSVIPRLKSWIRRVVLDEDDVLERTSDGKPSLAEEATAAAKAAAAAAAHVAKASQEMLITINEEKKCFTELMSLLDVQFKEIRRMRNDISKLEGQSYGAGRSYARDEYLDGSSVRSMQPANGKSEYDTRLVRSVSPPASAEPPHPKSYMEIMAMVQRGEKPDNVRVIDDSPPNPNQPISNPSLVPRAKPWEVSQPAGNSSFVPQPQVINEGSSYTAQDNGVTYQFNNDSSAPWWQQKNVRITENENVNGQKFGSAPSDTAIFDRPPQRRWVPPQPPPVSMPEAAVAMRQPKSSVAKDGTLRIEDASQPGNALEELQRVTQISESGGHLEANGGNGSFEINNGEIQEQVAEV